MSAILKVTLFVAFAGLYGIATPIRHPYFNSLVFVGLLFAIVAAAIVLYRRRLDWTAILLSIPFGYIASLVAYMATWGLEGSAGMLKYLHAFGSARLLANLMAMPFFSYSFMVLPVAVGLIFLFQHVIDRRIAA